MAKNNHLTKDDLLDTLVKFYKGQIKPDFIKLETKINKRFDGVNKRFDGVDKRLDRVEERLDGVEVELRYVKDEIKGVKSELSTTPSLKQFNTLKRKVDRHHPAN